MRYSTRDMILILLVAIVGTLDGLTAFDGCGYDRPCEPLTCRSATYVKLGGQAFLASKENPVVPIVAVGRRFESAQSAIDMSISYSSASAKTYAWQLPRMTYLRYIQPESNSSFYYGGGLSWTLIKKKGESYIKEPVLPEEIPEVKYRSHRFNGIAAEIIVGYQLSRESEFTTFLEFSLTQPVLPTSKNESSFKPVLALSFGAGF